MSKTKPVEAILKNIVLKGGRNKHIKATMKFATSDGAVAEINKMRRYFAILEEPDRGAPRKPLGEFSGRVGKISLSDNPDKLSEFEVIFDDSNLVLSSLCQIRECEPPTVLLIRTQHLIEDLESEPEAAAEEQMDLQAESA